MRRWALALMSTTVAVNVGLLGADRAAYALPEPVKKERKILGFEVWHFNPSVAETYLEERYSGCDKFKAAETGVELVELAEEVRGPEADLFIQFVEHVYPSVGGWIRENKQQTLGLAKAASRFFTALDVLQLAQVEQVRVIKRRADANQKFVSILHYTRKNGQYSLPLFAWQGELLGGGGGGGGSSCTPFANAPNGSSIHCAGFSGIVLRGVAGNAIVRNGPGRNYAEIGRLPSGTSLIFIAWCEGESVPDQWTGQPDNRWFVFRNGDVYSYIASAVVYGNPP